MPDENKKPTSEFERMERFKRWWKSDRAHSAKWRKEAERDYDFVAGEQWDKADRAFMEDQQRPVITFNRVLAIIKAVAGSEINNRQELKFLPRNVADQEEGPTGSDITKAEFLSGLSDWMADRTDAEDEQSEAFEDSLICGMGWTESRLDFDTDPDGAYVEDRVDPLEMYWDANARKKNLVDAKRLWRVRQVPAQDALAMHPGFDLEEIDATWAGLGDAQEPDTPIEQRRFHRSGAGDDMMMKKVTLVEVQWVELEPFFRTVDPNDPVGGRLIEMAPVAFERLRKLREQTGQTLDGVKQVRRVYKRAFVGATGLLGEISENHAGGQFSWQAITGERDRNKGTFFGLVKVMREPQMWANKWLSQTLHIMNRSAKGGVIAEKGIAEDQRQFEESWARTEAITWARQGKLQNGAIQPKPEATFPAGFVQLTELAISSIRDVSGINLELLGLRDANQPGILEAQRKRAAMTILATAFNALRRYRKAIGRIRLHYIQTHLSDGRMVRIMGKQGAQVLPVIRAATVGSFDVMVDESPTSPNQKEATWAAILALLPGIQGLITPEVMLTLLDYSPLPESLVATLKQLGQEPAETGDDPQALQARELALQAQLANVRARLAKAARDEAEATKTRAETALLGTTADPNVASTELPPVAI